jgi:hypothetical protein
MPGARRDAGALGDRVSDGTLLHTQSKERYPPLVGGIVIIGSALFVGVGG